MTNFFIYRTTSKTETLEPHMYIDKYSNPEVKDLMHRYKFNHDKDAEKILIDTTLDMCLDIFLRKPIRSLHIFISPPSTMFERGEKKVDSMFNLIHKAMKIFPQYVHSSDEIYCAKVFSIHSKYLQNKKAQHLDGNRKSRTTNLGSRYYISRKHKLYLWYCMHIRKIYHFSYSIIDDVSSTGGTLVACKQTLLTYLRDLQKKNPHISFDVEIYSLTH